MPICCTLRTLVLYIPYLYIYAPIHTYIPTHPHPHIHTSTHPHIHTPHTNSTSTHPHIQTHTFTHTNSRIHTSTHTHPHIHTSTPTHPHIQISIPTHPRIQIHTSTHTNSHPHIHTCKLTHPHIHTYKPTHVHMYTQTCAHSHTPPSYRVRRGHSSCSRSRCLPTSRPPQPQTFQQRVPLPLCSSCWPRHRRASASKLQEVSPTLHILALSHLKLSMIVSATCNRASPG